MPVTLKLATSLDGRIATGGGESRWITGAAAREEVHRLRADHDAVVIGIETALADDPELTVRLPGWQGVQPARVVLDSRQRLPKTSKLAETARVTPTFLISTTLPDAGLAAKGVKVLQIEELDHGRARLSSVAMRLAGEGLSRLFVEGGGQVAASFIRAGMVDAIEWFRAPIIIGGDGRAGIGDLALAALAETPHFRRIEVRPVGDDLWERYVRV